MQFSPKTAIGLALALSAWPVSAQTVDEAAQSEAPVELEAIDIEDVRAPLPAYRGFIAEDSGLSIIDKSSLKGLESGSGDMLDALRLIPNVHFDVNRQGVDRDNLLNLRPSDLSISGGQIYDNSIRIDGIAVDNVMDVSEDNPFALNEVAGASAQTIFLDPTLIDSLEIRDSNISARFGEFSGGVVDARLRDPADRFGATLRFGLENDSLTEYVVDETADMTAADAPPTFTRWRLHGTVDVPVNDRLKLMLGAGRSRAEVDYPVSANYGGDFRGMRSTSDNFIVKGTYDLTATTRLTSSLTYSPYESQASNQNGYDNLIISKGGGLAFKTELAGKEGDFDWLLRGSYVDADMSREAPPNNFSWSSAAPSIDFCSASSCTSGGFGDLEQYQKDMTLEAEGSYPVLGGKLAFGGEIGQVEAHRSRDTESRAYLSGVYNPATVCADPADPACIDGEIALTRALVYLPYEANVEILQGALWAEHSQSFGPVDVRAGLRWSGEDYLENTQLSPRLSAVWNIHGDWQLTAGTGRYYTRNFVGYAIREQYPHNYQYRRTGALVNGSLVFSDNWALYSHTVPTGYRDRGLATPYSDEATLALSFPALGALNGIGRVKAVQRWHRDQIVRLPVETIEDLDSSGATYTQRVYFPSNDGKTDYLGLSAEWSGSWRNTALTLSTSWSETYNNADNLGGYFDEQDDEALMSTFVLYQGEILSLAELQSQAQRENFALPFSFNAALRSSWLSERLDTTLWFYWKGEYETIADTGINETINGVRYDVFDKVVRDASLRVDLNAAYKLPALGPGNIELEARVSNLFNELPYTDVSTSYPYQRGRSIWLGLNWKY